MEFLTQFAATVAAIFVVLAAVLTGMERLRKLVASDILAELRVCNEARTSDAKHILTVTRDLAIAETRIAALEQIARDYLTPIGGRARASDNPAVQKIIAGEL